MMFVGYLMHKGTQICMVSMSKSSKFEIIKNLVKFTSLLSFPLQALPS